MSSRNRRQLTLRLETLERRDLLTAAAQLVSDFDFSNVSSRNSPISVVTAEDSTYEVVTQKDEHGVDYTSVGRIDIDASQFGRVEGHVEQRAVVEGQLYVVTTTDWENRHHTLWKSDGTGEGTVRLLTMDGRSLDNLKEFNNRLYFTASDELWVTDGTESRTKSVKDLNPHFHALRGSVR